MCVFGAHRRRAASRRSSETHPRNASSRHLEHSPRRRDPPGSVASSPAASIGRRTALRCGRARRCRSCIVTPKPRDPGDAKAPVRCERTHAATFSARKSRAPRVCCDVAARRIERLRDARLHAARRTRRCVAPRVGSHRAAIAMRRRCVLVHGGHDDCAGRCGSRSPPVLRATTAPCRGRLAHGPISLLAPPYP